MNRKTGIAIIGCGSIAKLKHIPALLHESNSEWCELTGFCDHKQTTAEQFKNSYGAEHAIATTNYSEILKSPYIDVVHICTANQSHAELTIAALEAGKHVMCEKPMAHTCAAAREMMEAAERTGKKLCISYQNRFRSDSQAVHKYCMNKDLGEIYFAKAHAVRRKRVPTWGVFTSLAAQGGGPLIDIGTHAIDLALWHMDNYDVDYVMGTTFQMLKDHPEGNVYGEWVPEKYEVEDSAFATVKMKNGALLYVEASWALNTLDVREAATTLCGTLGGAEQYNTPKGINSYTYSINFARHGDLVTIKPDPKELYTADSDAMEDEVLVAAPRAEMHAWMEAIRNDTQPAVLPYQAYTVSRIIEAIYESARTGKPVYFDKV